MELIMKNIAIINKSTLLHIIESKSVTYSYLESKMKISDERIRRWTDESDIDFPTIKQAKDLSKHLRVPFAGLYMNSKDIKEHHLRKVKNLRILHGTKLYDDSALNIAIIDLLNARMLLIDNKKELEEAIHTFKISIQSDEVTVWARKIRELFSIELSKQYSMKSSRQLYLYIRNQIEKQNVFVHGFSGVNIEDARGVSIHSNILPIIGVNIEDRPPAKSFTIIHELVHIINNRSTICNEMYNSFSANTEEIFCNAVAGEVLVPSDALFLIMRNYPSGQYTTQDIHAIAKRFCVSKEVIIRRFLELGFISENKYLAFVDEFITALEMQKEELKELRKEGKPFFPKYVYKIVDKNSTALSTTLSRSYKTGLMGKQDIARYLGIAHKHIDSFLNEVSVWNK